MPLCSRDCWLAMAVITAECNDAVVITDCAGDAMLDIFSCSVGFLLRYGWKPRPLSDELDDCVGRMKVKNVNIVNAINNLKEITVIWPAYTYCSCFSTEISCSLFEPCATFCNIRNTIVI